MNIKDLTKEQAIEITKLLFPFPDSIRSDFEMKYFDGNYGNWTDPRDEILSVSFDAHMLPEDKINKIYVHIYPDLDCSIGIFEKMENGPWCHKKSLPVRDQYKIQNKFKEWKIEPKYH